MPFCSNGTVLDRPTGAQHGASDTQPLHRRARAASVVVAVLLLVATAVAVTSAGRLLSVRGDRQAADRAATTAEAAATATVDDLSAQQAFLAEAGVDLGAARAALGAADDVLDAASHDRAAVAAELAAAQQHLAELHAAVTGAEGEAFANAGLVNALAECLEGVSALVNQLAVGDRGGAVRTADAIAPACAAVGAAIA